jgi:hypothetical protein
MELLSEYASWETFAAVQAGAAEAEILRVQRRLDIIKATKMSGSMKKVTEARNDAVISPEYTTTDAELVYNQALYRGHTIQRDAMERYGKVVSRELTRRTSNEARHPGWAP